MLDFEMWYSINPLKETLDELALSDVEKKKLTPVIVASTFIVEARKYYSEFVKRKQRYIVPSFIRKEFTIYYKKRYFSILPLYDLEKELEYLISVIPEASIMYESVVMKDMFPQLLKEEMKTFKRKLKDALNEPVKVQVNDIAIGYKFKEERP